MAIGPDVQVFISAARALLQYKSGQALNEEEQEKLKCCVDELVAATNCKKQGDKKTASKAAVLPYSRFFEEVSSIFHVHQRR